MIRHGKMYNSWDTDQRGAIMVEIEGSGRSHHVEKTLRFEFRRNGSEVY
jgi:hypothetical protein